jgi:protein gp37
MASDHSSIEWTEATWNPTSGCTEASPGCDRCYPERITHRPTFSSGASVVLFEAPIQAGNTNDGHRCRWRQTGSAFSSSLPAGENRPPPIDVVVNWQSLLKK